MVRFNWLNQVAIIVVVFSMAMPVRLWVAFGPFSSVSVMDLVLVLAGCFLFLHGILRGGWDVGNKVIFGMLCVPLMLGITSLAWSQDATVTMKWVLIMAESQVAYLVGVQLYVHCAKGRAVWYMGLFIVVCLAGSVLSLMRVPGFEVTVPPEYPYGSTAYLIYLYSYYARLSHPFIGLSNALARALVSYVLILFVWAVMSRHRGYYVLVLVTVLAIVFTLSRGLLIPFAATSLILLSRTELRRFLLWLLPVAALLSLAVFGVYSLVPELGSTLSDRTSESNVLARAEKVTIGLNKIMSRPVVGYGAGVAADGDEQLVGGSHNILLDMVLYFGIIPGLFVCCCLVVVAVVFLTWGTADSSVRLMSNAIGLTVVCQLLGFLSESAFDTSVLRVLLYFFIGSSVSLLRVMKVEVQQAKSAGTPNNALP